MRDNEVVFNGIDAVTGSYISPSATVEQLAALAQGRTIDADRMDELTVRQESLRATWGVPFGVDPQDLAACGWGVLFAHGTEPAIRDALAPLLSARAEDAGDLFRQFVGEAAYRPGERARTWLARQGVGPGQVQVKKVPYYLLIVGDPESIPFRFQYEIGLNYAVGRIHFDTIGEYAQYAVNVVANESIARGSEPRDVVFFGARNPADQATTLSTDQLVVPLAHAVERRGGATCRVRRVVAQDATKKALGAILNGGSPPSLLFTASHGMGFPNGHPLQLRHQGALLCQDWPGPLSHVGPIPPEQYFSADDLSSASSLGGMIAFHFACYGAGTPRFDDYSHRDGVRSEIAAAAFLARLPQRMLSQPGGGALAAVGHVERAWGYSFMWPGAGAQTEAFENCIGALLEGSRIGVAMEAFSARHADLAVSLNGELEDIKFGATPNPVSIANLWTANNDARSYVIVGDPAVRMRNRVSNSRR